MNRLLVTALSCFACLPSATSAQTEITKRVNVVQVHVGKSNSAEKSFLYTAPEGYRITRYELHERKRGGDAKWLVGRVEDEVYVMVGDYKHLIQKIRFADGRSWDGSTFAYRTGYYTYQDGKKAIKWGQYTQFLTEKEYSTLLQKAKGKAWAIF